MRRSVWLWVVPLVAIFGVVYWLNRRPYRRSLLPPIHAAVVVAPLRVPVEPAPKATTAPAVGLAALDKTPLLAPSSVTPVATPPFEYTDNFLLVGLDRRPFGGGPSLSDTIVVAVFDEASGALGLVSIPRDLWVDIPGHAADRINTVMNVARSSGEDPLALLGRVVENTLGLPIEHAVAIDIGVFERAVDTLGGVTVSVPCPIIDRFVDPRDPSGYRKLDVPAGTVRLDGVTAAMYVRSRHGRSDFSRARRQQAVLLGLRHELTNAGGLVRLPTLFGKFEDSLETDLRRIDVLTFGQRLLRVAPQNLHGLVLGSEQVTAHMTPDGKAVLLPNPAAISAALGKLFSAPPPGAAPAGSVCPKADIALMRGAG